MLHMTIFTITMSLLIVILAYFIEVWYVRALLMMTMFVLAFNTYTLV